jgi:putative oxidoreductase
MINPLGFVLAWMGGRAALRRPEWAYVRPVPVAYLVLLAAFVLTGGKNYYLLGLLPPLAAAGAVGTMAVAFVTAHLRNGFFIFRPGQGYEYVLMIIMVACGLGALGGGTVSLDNALGLSDELSGWAGLAITALAGGLGAALLLAVFWRPAKQAAEN